MNNCFFKQLAFIYFYCNKSKIENVYVNISGLVRILEFHDLEFLWYRIAANLFGFFRPLKFNRKFNLKQSSLSNDETSEKFLFNFSGGKNPCKLTATVPVFPYGEFVIK